MNCKPGDLAVIVGSTTTEANGHLVTCVRLLDGCQPVDGIEWNRIGSSPVWLIESFGCGVPWKPLTQKVMRRAASDAILRPIRDNPGDESFVTESRKSLRTARENAALKKVTA
jgi:hypothetical protein